MELRGKVALVTGGGRRVGRALALALANRGATVAVHYNESDKGAAEVADAIAGRKGRAAVFSADLTDPSAPRRLVQDVVAKFSQLDVLVNSAAIMLRTPFGETETTEWDRVFALNLRAPFFLAQEAAPYLRTARGAIDLANRAEMIRQMGDAADDAVQLDAADVARRAQRVEPASRLGRQIVPQLLPLGVGDCRFAPARAPIGAAERILFAAGPPVHERQAVAQVIDVGGNGRGAPGWDC